MSGRKEVPHGQSLTGFGVCSGSSDRAIGWLRRQFKDKAAQHVEAETGIPFNTARKWFSGESRPNGDTVFLLIFAFGPELLAAAFPKGLGWLDSAVRSEKLAALKAKQAEIQQQVEALL